MRRRGLLSWLLVACSALVVSLPGWADPWPSIPIPPENARDLQRPAPRPPEGDAAERARHLVEALRTGAAEGAMDFFLPRDPFLAIKDMSGAAGYFNTLTRAYRRDIEAWRRETPGLSRATFVRFELSRACAWMTPGREANRLPYWSCYRSRLVVNVDGRERPLEVRVMIHWGRRWYVTHLRPFH
ncbi:MAG: hypothetical protein U0324_27100 [Polyangiales bacterium]